MRTNFEPEDLEIFRALIREEVRQELATMKPKEETYLTREEAAAKLRISLPTLHSWMGKGMIQKSKMGNRVLIPESEVQKMILKMRD